MMGSGGRLVIGIRCTILLRRTIMTSAASRRMRTWNRRTQLACSPPSCGPTSVKVSYSYRNRSFETGLILTSYIITSMVVAACISEYKRLPNADLLCGGWAAVPTPALCGGSLAEGKPLGRRGFLDRDEEGPGGGVPAVVSSKSGSRWRLEPDDDARFIPLMDCYFFHVKKRQTWRQTQSQ
jgi:hypothetical protein